MPTTIESETSIWDNNKLKQIANKRIIITLRAALLILRKCFYIIGIN